MNYFVCTYGYFPEQDELVKRSFRENSYLIHQYARHPSAVDTIAAGDILLLNVRGQGILAYATAAGPVEHIEAADEWNYIIKVQPQWYKSSFPASTYGISWATLQGGQFSLVKQVEDGWANKVLYELTSDYTREANFGNRESENNNRDTPVRYTTPFAVATELMEGVLNIPAVQRGVVWNATRLEVLWDSISRSIPIGTFSIRATEDEENSLIWDLLDGQQRANAIMSAYRSFPPTPTQVEMKNPETAKERALLAPVVWIDLLGTPNPKSGRKYLFRVTTASQPWGYRLTDDETNNAKLIESEKQSMCREYDWQNKQIGGLLSDGRKPFPCELVPFEAECPIPFSLILQCYRERKENNTYASNPSVEDFIVFCKTIQASSSSADGLRPWNWFDSTANNKGFLSIFHSSRKEEVKSRWNEFIQKVCEIENYPILQVNARSVSTDDIGVYFKRIGRGGVVPSQEEMNYSMLKARLPQSFKDCMDVLSQSGWAAPSRMAMLALRTWRDRDSPETSGSDEAIVNAISANDDLRESFKNYTSNGEANGAGPSFKADLNSLDGLLGINSGTDTTTSPRNGLLPWHRMVICTRFNGAICQYLLHLIATNRVERDVNYAGVAAFLFSFSNLPEKVIFKYLMSAETLRKGISSAYQDSHYGRPLLKSLIEPRAIDALLNEVACDDFCGAWRRIKSNPIWQHVVQVVKTGYRSEAAYSVLLFGCRGFLSSVFPKYNGLLPIWVEDNCPWDYDHIFPQVKRDDMRKAADGCEDILDSIGNLAPLPFSLNRSKHDSMPTKDYPLDALSERDNGLQQQLEAYKFGLMMQNETGSLYNYSDFGEKDDINAKEVFLQTIRRFNRLYKYWFENLDIGSVLPRTTERKEFFDALKIAFPENEFSIWIPGVNEQEITIDERPFLFGMSDWISCDWISFGKCVDEFFVAYGDNGRDWFTTGICKLPKEVSVRKDLQISISNPEFETPEKDNYWYVLKKYQKRPTIEEVKTDLNILMDQANKRKPS